MNEDDGIERIHIENQILWHRSQIVEAVKKLKDVKIIKMPPNLIAELLQKVPTTPPMEPSVYDILAHRLTLARSKHPQGASFDALLSEVGEVADERLAGNRDRERDELLDVAVVAIRLYLGETWVPF